MKSIFTKTNNSSFHKKNNNKVSFFHLTKNVRWNSLLNLLTTVMRFQSAKSIHAAVAQSRPQFGHKETSSGKASLILLTLRNALQGIQQKVNVCSSLACCIKKIKLLRQLFVLIFFHGSNSIRFHNLVAASDCLCPRTP